MCVFQSKAEDVFTFFKRKRRFLHRCVLFKENMKACSPFSKEKDVFCTDVCFSRQSWRHAHLFQKKKTVFAQMCVFQGKAEGVHTFFKRKKYTFCTAGWFSRQRWTRGHLFQTKVKNIQWKTVWHRCVKLVRLTGDSWRCFHRLGQLENILSTPTEKSCQRCVKFTRCTVRGVRRIHRWCIFKRFYRNFLGLRKKVGKPVRPSHFRCSHAWIRMWTKN